MPTDIKLTEYGDLDLSTGDLVLIDETDEVAQMCQTKILKVWDEDEYAPETGIRWFQRMYDFKIEDSQRQLEVRNAILSIPEITNVTLMTLSRDDNGMISIVFEADSEFGTISTVNE